MAIIDKMHLKMLMQAQMYMEAVPWNCIENKCDCLQLENITLSIPLK